MGLFRPSQPAALPPLPTAPPPPPLFGMTTAPKKPKSGGAQPSFLGSLDTQTPNLANKTLLGTG